MRMEVLIKKTNRGKSCGRLDRGGTEEVDHRSCMNVAVASKALGGREERVCRPSN